MQSHHKFVGLSPEQIEKSKILHGSNTLPFAKHRLWITLLSRNFTKPVRLLLQLCSFFAILVAWWQYSEHCDGPTVFIAPVSIFVVCLINTLIFTTVQWKTMRSLRILHEMERNTPCVAIRGGRAVTIAKSDIVTGDILFVREGMIVPADGDILQSYSMTTDERIIDGNNCVKKRRPRLHEDSSENPDETTLSAGTIITSGHGVMRVLAIGDSTRLAKITGNPGADYWLPGDKPGAKGKSPVRMSVNVIYKHYLMLAGALGAGVFIGKMLLYFLTSYFDPDGFMQYLLQSLMLATAVVMAGAPGAIPSSARLTIARAYRMMIRDKILVKAPYALEMSSAINDLFLDDTILCDTRKMNVGRTDIFDKDSQGIFFEALASSTYAVITADKNGNTRRAGFPVDGAILHYIADSGADYNVLRENVERIAELPFSRERGYEAVLIENKEGKHILYVKGNPEIVRALSMATDGVSDEKYEAMLREYREENGMMPLALAYREVTEGLGVLTEQQILGGNIHEELVKEKPLTMIGIIGITKPEVEGTREATEYLAAADVSLHTLPTTPEELKSLRDNDVIVGIVGHSYSDCPNMKAANIGYAATESVDLPKRIARMALLEDSLAAIANAVKWGRTLVHSLARQMLCHMTVGMSAALIVLLSVALGLVTPLSVTQLLWINLIAGIIAPTAISTLRFSPREIVRPHITYHDALKMQDGRLLVTPKVWHASFWQEGLMFVICALMMVYFAGTELTSLLDVGKLPYKWSNGLSVYQMTLIFTTYVFLIYWNLFNIRALNTGRSAFHLKGCTYFLISLILIPTVQILIVEFGDNVFNVTPLKWTDWLITFAGSSIILWTGEIIRLLTPRKYKLQPQQPQLR